MHVWHISVSDNHSAVESCSGWRCRAEVVRTLAVAPTTLKNVAILGLIVLIRTILSFARN
jgi:hypothetical protein